MKLRTVTSVSSSLVILAACASSPPPAAPASAPASASAAASAPASASASASASARPDDAAIDAAEKAYVDAFVEYAPESATYLGLHARDADLNDYTLAGSAAILGKQKEMLASLEKRFAHADASREKAIDLALLEHALRVSIRVDEERRPLERSPESYLAPMGALFLMVARDYAPAAERAKNVTSRLEKLPAVVASAKSNLKNPPKIWTQIALESAKQSGPFFDMVQPFLASSLSGDDRARADKALAGARAASADYAAFLEKDLHPRSNGEFAAGRPFFEFMLHEGDFLKEGADDVAAIGKRVFDETNASMTALAKKMDPKAKGWPEVLAKLKANHPSAADLIPSYKREVARAKEFLVAKDVVPFSPGEVCDVLETPPFLRNVTTASYDQAPPFDPQTRGFFFVTPVDASLKPKEQEELLRDNNHAEQVDTVVHETYPGHHLQISFSRLHPSLIRKATGSDVFAEGWGLYSEELMDELGYYSDEERMAYLQWALVRAARVRIDVGLHTQGMTFDQAVGVLTNEVHLEKVLAVNEVKRYTASPTQPLSYMIGREKIRALREKAKQRDGASFSLKKFHADLLSHGTIPPDLIEAEMFGGG